MGLAGRGIGSPMGWTIYGGAASPSATEENYPVSFGGFSFMVDYQYAQQFNLQPIPYIRQQSDQSESPGEQSLDPAGFWRRSATSWHLGAGQTHYDREDSSPFRFNTSKGIKIWDKWRLSLLHDTDEKLNSANTNLELAVAGTHIYTPDGTALKYCTNIDVDTPTFTALTGTAPTNAASSIVSDGNNVWTAHGTQGIFQTTRGTAAWAGSEQVTGTVDLLGRARGRILAASGNNVYDVTSVAYAGGVLPSALLSHSNSDFTWTGFAEGRNAVYMAGYSGDKSLIYRSTINTTTGALDLPIVAGELPDGEQVVSLYGYLGPFLMIGIAGLPGWRFALINDNGDLNIGSRVTTTNPVYAFEGQESFIWYSLGNYDSTSSGTGRLSLQYFSDDEGLVPAYASDLMYDVVNYDTTSIATFDGVTVFVVTDGSSDSSIVANHHDRNLVADGHLETGQITYNLTEEKMGLYVDVSTFESTQGSHYASISLDNGSFTSLGERVTPQTFPIGEARAMSFEIRVGLKRDGTTATAGQTITSWLMRSQVVPSITEFWSIPLVLASPVRDLYGQPRDLDTWAAIQKISSLTRSKDVFRLVVNEQAYSVILEGYNMVVSKMNNNQVEEPSVNGTIIPQFKILTEAL